MNTISVRDRSFIDEKGRERIFNGINFVDKHCLPDDDGVIRFQTALNDETLSAVAARGVNIVRLGVTWAAIEPVRGAYNTVYLDGVKQTLALCEKYGVYAFLDWHQDLYSYYCCRGDGAPKWACVGNREKVKDPVIIWATGYFLNRSVQRSFDAFWENRTIDGKGVQDSFCDMLTYTADYLKGSPALMGYDLLNEPFPGTPGGRIFRTLVKNGAATLLFSKRVDRKKMLRDLKDKKVMDTLSVADDPKVYHSVIDGANGLLYRFDTERYYPFLRKAAAAIRRADPDGVIFCENCYYSNTGIPCSYPRLTYPDGVKEPNIAFAPHGYDLTVDTPLTNEASPHRVDHIFDEHARTQARMDVPVLVGEWGGMVPGGEKYPALEHLIDKFDRNRWSQTYWHWFDGMESSRIMDILSRPLPQAVAGSIKSYGYDRKNDVFTLSYTGSSVVKAPTLVWLPKPPKKVYSTKKYELRQTDAGLILQVYAGKGACIVKVEF